MKVAIGSDHGGFHLKEVMVKFLAGKGHQVLDLGAHTHEPSDYPDFAKAVAGAIIRGDAERGILICGSGVGASVAANKFPGIRAAVCHDTFSSHQGVEDDEMNVLCLGERVIGPELAKEIVVSFLSARFSGAERHERRLKKVREIENAHMK
ncbi:MAG TPA: ribose 5-phosphate isomerase B [Thermodesulfovibrionales bacterium]|nr:ribose 5-phosphate isomerase B [Thermodesulfovibrionales bacterium]